MAFLQVLAFGLCLGAALASDVIELDNDNFDSGIAGKELVLVEFYAPWCGHCKRLAPEYEKAATRLLKNDPPVSLAKVDCIANADVCSKYGVSGYPTLKIARNGAVTSDYNGPREEDGIVSYMAKQVGPSSKELADQAAFDKFLKADEHSIIGFFARDDDKLYKAFMKMADGNRDNFRFAHTNNADLMNEHGRSNVVVFQPPKMKSKLEEPTLKFRGDADNLESWVKENFMGVAGVLTPENEQYFTRKPLVVAYFDVDYVKNPKGSNYWRNRVLKVAKEFKKEKVFFAIGSKSAHGRYLDEVGLANSDHEVVVAARGAKDEKYPMKEKFSVDNLKAFVTDLLAGNLEAYIKSEDVPADNDGPVKVVVGKNFAEIVDDEEKDVLIEFYAPWCGHCKSLEPKYKELGETLKPDNPNIVIAKMDATANDVPPAYSVSGFPTLYFRKAGQSTPQRYEGGREVSDFISYLKKNAKHPVVVGGGKKKKSKKSKKSKDEL